MTNLKGRIVEPVAKEDAPDRFRLLLYRFGADEGESVVVEVESVIPIPSQSALWRGEWMGAYEKREEVPSPA